MCWSCKYAIKIVKRQRKVLGLVRPRVYTTISALNSSKTWAGCCKREALTYKGVADLILVENDLTTQTGKRQKSTGETNKTHYMQKTKQLAQLIEGSSFEIWNVSMFYDDFSSYVTNYTHYGTSSKDVF